MKCDELKYERLGDMMPFYPRSTLVIRKQFVDAAIDELKREHHRERHEYIDMVALLKAKLVEQESENRKLKRALYKACANWAYVEVLKESGGIQMSELKIYHCNEWHNPYTEFYLKTEADKVIADLATENTRLKKQLSCTFKTEKKQ